MKRLSSILSIAALSAFLFSYGAAADQSKAKARADKATEQSEDALDAARKGDEALMKELTGSSVRLTAKPEKKLRESLNYQEFVVWTGPSFKLGGAQGGFDVVIRVPRSVAPDKLPDLLQAEGRITDFVRSDSVDHSHDGKRIGWMPVITISVLK